MDTIERVILHGIMGSRSVGTHTEDSDYDEMAVVLASDDVYLGLDYYGNQGTREIRRPEENLEVVQYEFTKFLRLCKNFNPNVIPLLYLNRSSYVATPEGMELIENRDMFNSWTAVESFCGFAYNQLKKMKQPTGKQGEKRKKLIEKYGYDTKYAYHAIRLSEMLNEFIQSDGQVLNVWRGDIDKDFLIEIREGKYPYEWVVGRVEAMTERARKAIKQSKIPEKVDKERISNFCRRILRKHLCL